MFSACHSISEEQRLVPVVTVQTFLWERIKLFSEKAFWLIIKLAINSTKSEKLFTSEHSKKRILKIPYIPYNFDEK